MKKPSDVIPVVVASPEPSTQPPARVLAILREIEEMLERLIATGESNAIDISHAPLSTIEVAMLKDNLGEGEVSAQLESLGTTSLRETSVSGVWWVTHRTSDGRILAESIEVTPCPELLMTSTPDLRSGLGLLKKRLSRQFRSSDPGRISERLEALGFCAPSSDRAQSSLNESVKTGKP